MAASKSLINKIEISTHIKYLQDNKVAGDARRAMSKNFLNDGKLCIKLIYYLNQLFQGRTGHLGNVV